MPSVSLLNSENFLVKKLTIRVVSFFKELVNTVVVSAGDDENNVKVVNNERKSKATEQTGTVEPQQQVQQPQQKQQQIPVVEKTDATSLFPKKHNVDMALLGSSSVIPCAMDITSLDTPMTMSVTPEGNFACKLNNDEYSSKHLHDEKSPLRSPLCNGDGLPMSPQSNSSTTPPKDDEAIIKDEVPADADEKGFYVCHYCDAKFRIRGYLTRHIKKHAIQKAYHCPFFNVDSPPELRCHNSGGFSRRDTYKTHLKARHFAYPKGVKPQDRNKSPGHCSQCGLFFENTDNWVEQHIETGDCQGLPKGYLKNIKSERKSGKLRMIKTSTGHSRFISTAQSVVEPKVLLNKDALEAMAIVAQNTNRSDILSKYGNNKIMMSSANFKGEPTPKRKYTRRKGTASKDIEMIKKEHDESYTQSNSNDESPFEKPRMFSCGSNSASDYMDDETALNEISSSLNPSPPDHHVLEPVPSTSSESSQEYHQPLMDKHDVSTKAVGLSNFSTVIFNDPFSVPLDMEQCSFYNGGIVEGSTIENRNNTSSLSNNNGLKSIAINETLRKQMDPVLLGENHIRENEQYLNFYNYTFGANI